MFYKRFLFLVLISILFSCSPNINSHFTKRYPELSKKDTVKIFDVDEYANRDNSKDEVLGFVSVRDAGTTTNCSYDRMLQIVKDSALANGGNIIGLKQHLKPSFFGSTCHQFYADILKSNSNKIDSLGIPFSSNKESNYYVSTYEQNTLKNRFTINLNTGIAFRIGIKDTSSEFNRAFSDAVKTGATFSISSLYKLKKNTLLGLKYTYAYYGGVLDNIQTTFNDGRPTEYGFYNIDQHIHFIGLNSYSVYPLGKGKNEIIINSTLGYVSYQEKNGIDTIITTTGGSLGYDINLGYLYNITERFGMGINLGLFLGNIANITVDNGVKKESYNYDSDNAIGISNFNTGLHLSYSF